MAPHLLELLEKLTPPAETARELGLPAGPLWLRRAWPRAAGHLLLEYGAADGTIVPGQWRLEERDALRAVAKLPAADAAMFELPGEGYVTLQLRGADGRLPALAPILAQPGARLLVHQPGRRAVARLPRPDGVAFAKLAPPGRARAVADAGVEAGRLGGERFSTPRLLACDDEAGVVIWSALAGVALHDLPGGAALEAGARQAGEALRWLHEAAPPEAAARHGPAEEVAVIARWIERAAAFDPEGGATLAALAPAIFGPLLERQGPIGPIHRDFYDKQVLIDTTGQAGLLDFDTLATGEPALDVANALVHFELRALQGTISVEQAERAGAALLAGYRAGPHVWERLSAYMDGARLRLICVYSFRPRWRSCVAALRERVGRRLAARQALVI